MISGVLIESQMVDARDPWACVKAGKPPFAETKSAILIVRCDGKSRALHLDLYTCLIPSWLLTSDCAGGRSSSPSGPLLVDTYLVETTH